MKLKGLRARMKPRGGRRRRNPVEDLKREVAIMRTLRHKNIVSLQVGLLCHAHSPAFACPPLRLHDSIEFLLLCLLCLSASQILELWAPGYSACLPAISAYFLHGSETTQ